MSTFYFCSTYSDLKEHRQAAIAAFREFAQRNAESYVDYDFFDPNVFAETGATNLDASLREARECSYFVLILGWRYGYIPKGSKKSIVELEYDAALTGHATFFCFQIDDSYPVSPKFIEGGQGAEKLKAFKRLVQERNLVARFSTPDDLARELTLAVSVLNRPLGDALKALVEQSVLAREHRQYREEAKLLKGAVHFYKRKLDRVVPADPIWKGRKFEADNTLCFVLMPLSDPFFLLYEEAIVPALEAAGLRGIHAGQIFGTREIMEDVWESICVSRVVVADVTGRNPNVFYELGIAHTLGKECIVLTQNSQDVPFDISSRRYIRYEPTKLVALRTRLETTIKKILT
jgi:Domain of unknown function (DUF4062)